MYSCVSIALVLSVLPWEPIDLSKEKRIRNVSSGVAAIAAQKQGGR